MGGATTWEIRTADPGLVAAIATSLNVRHAVAACLVNRGLLNQDDAEAFLDPRLQELDSPSTMAEMDRAASRLARAVKERERVGVFGDYDVDGITSAAVVSSFLKALETPVECEIADRFVGYGIGADAVRRFVDLGCTLIIALDLGTSDKDAAAAAAAAGIDLIIIDHHTIRDEYPDAFAFVNPVREDSDFPDTRLAAVGLAFYFTAATRTVLTENGFLSKKDIDVRPLLDLVALGTVADVMPLTGNNRILVSHGLRYLSDTRRLGLKSLMRVAKIRTSKMRAEHIAFQLAPRLNAAGRLGRAKESFDLLMATDPDTADRLAAKLDQLSQERRQLENDVLGEARRMIAAGPMLDHPILFVAGRGWHRGVVGIVASRLSEEFGRPAFVVGVDDDIGVGSVRGRGQISVYDSLMASAEALERFGGHRDAAGFTVRADNLNGLRDKLIAYARDHVILVEGERLQCDASLIAAEVTPAFMAEVSRLGPFGPGNPEPIFDIDGLFVLNRRVVGQEHLKLELKTPTGRLSAFGPRMAKVVDALPPLIRVAATVSPDEWRGQGNLELKLQAVPVPGT